MSDTYLPYAPLIFCRSCKTRFALEDGVAPPEECPKCGGSVYVTAQKPFYDCFPPSSGGPLFPALVGPARIGKTQTGAAKLLSYLFAFPGRYAVVGPTYKNHLQRATIPKYKELLRYATDKIKLVDGDVYHETQQCIRFKPDPVNGIESQIDFFSAEDPIQMWGPTYAGVHIDEAGQIKEASIAIVEARLTDPEGPRQGLVTFTPRGDRSHWTYRYYGHQYEESLALANNWETGWVERGDFPVGTLIPEQNPWLSEKLLAHLRSQARFSALREQEYYGEWFESGGVIYEDFDPNIHVRPLSESTNIIYKVAGVDWGTIEPTAIIVVGRDELGRTWWLHEFYRPKCYDMELYEELSRIRSRWPNIHLYCDPSEPTRIEALRANGFLVHKANREVNARVSTIRSLLKRDGSSLPGMFVVPSCLHSINEFQSWSTKEGRGVTGTVQHEQVEAGAHCLDAGGYAILALQEGLMKSMPIPVIWGGQIRAKTLVG